MDPVCQRGGITVKHIVHLIYGLDMGGAQTLVKEYALGINKNKFHITVLCLNNFHAQYDKLLSQAGVEVVYVSDCIPFYGEKGIFFRAWNKICKYYFTRKLLRQLRPDIVHIHLPINRFVKFAHLPRTTQIFYTQHFDVARLQNYPRDVKALRYLIQRHRTQLIALHDTMRQQLNQLFGVSNTVVLNNGINLARFKPTKPKAQIRRNLGIPQDAFVLGHVGRLNPVKNQSFLIKIAAHIRKYHNPNTWLLLAGDGADRTKLEHEIFQSDLQHCALILSYRTDVPDLLSAMDRFVFPSISEGLGIAVIEAQAAGVPCIVSAAVPQTVQISNLITFKSLQDSLSSWAQAILAQPPSVQYTHLEEWDISQIIRQLEALYEQ